MGAMYDREAMQKLAADPTLEHLYHDPAGVEVKNAGDAQVNGWYHRKEAAEGPPRGWPEYLNEELWAHYNMGPHWYEKDDGCFLYLHARSAPISTGCPSGRQRPHSWYIHAPDGYHRYRRPVPA